MSIAVLALVADTVIWTAITIAAILDDDAADADVRGAVAILAGTLTMLNAIALGITISIMRAA